MHSEFASIQHSSCRVGLKQVVHVLRDARGISTVLSHTLPKGEQEVSAILVLEQKVDFMTKMKVFLPLALFCVMRFRVESRTTSIPIGISCLLRSRIPRFTAVVVFSTPPFWLHIAMILRFGISLFLLLVRFGSLDLQKHRNRVLCFGGRI